MATSATDAFKELLRVHIAPALREAGFTGSGTSYVVKSATHWVMLGFQGSTANTSQRVKFTVNCKVVRKDVWADAYAERPYIGAQPKPNVSAGTFEWWKRIGSLMPGGQDHWWWLGTDDDPVAVGLDVVDALNRHALPRMRDEIARTS